MKLQKVRVYLNAEFMDLLDYFASFYATTNSEVLRFSLRSKDGFYKKPKRAQSVFYKQKRIKKDFEAIKKKQAKILPLPYFQSDEFAREGGEAKSIFVA